MVVLIDVFLLTHLNLCDWLVFVVMLVGCLLAHCLVCGFLLW